METNRVVRVERGECATTKIIILVGRQLITATDEEAREVACKILELLLIETGGKMTENAPAMHAA